MPTRREFILSAAGTAVLLSVGGCATLGGVSDNAVESAAAVTRVFGDGMRLVAVRLTFRHWVDAKTLSIGQFKVAGRTITGLTVSNSEDGRETARGHYVTLALNPYDEGALLTVKKAVPPTSLPTPPLPKTARARRATRATARPRSKPPLPK